MSQGIALRIQVAVVDSVIFTNICLPHPQKTLYVCPVDLRHD